MQVGMQKSKQSFIVFDFPLFLSYIVYSLDE